MSSLKTLPQTSVLQRHSRYDASLASPYFLITFCFGFLSSVTHVNMGEESTYNQNVQNKKKKKR